MIFLTFTVFGLEINILAQVFDIIALMLTVISYQGSKAKYLVFYSAATVLFSAEAFVLGAYTGVICNTVSIIRNMTILFYLKKDRELPKLLVWIFMIPFAIIAVIYVIKLDIVSAAPAAFCLTMSIATACKSEGTLKTASVFVESGYAVYSFAIGAYVGVIRQIFAVGSAIVGTVRYYKGKQRKKEEANL